MRILLPGGYFFAKFVGGGTVALPSKEYFRMRTLSLAAAAAAVLFFALTSCSGSASDGDSTGEDGISFKMISARVFTLFSGESTKHKLIFETDSDWSLDLPSSASWLVFSAVEGHAGGLLTRFSIEFSYNPSSPATTDEVTLHILLSDGSRQPVSITLKGLSQCSDFEIPDDMIFSVTLGRNTTNVAQGFDYDPQEDVIYIMQKYATYRNHIGWQKRTTQTTSTVAPQYMTLNCFSHANNVSIEKSTQGKFVWSPNWGTRQSDGSYDNPHVVSRFALQTGQELWNTDTEENYYFGLKNTWPAFDFDADLMAVCDYSFFYIYKLSELRKLPDEEITLDFTVTYGGSIVNSSGTTVDTKIPEWTGKPKIRAKDCRKVTPLYKVPFDYTKRGLHWQTYCIRGNWIYALLQADTKSAPDIIFDTYLECYRMDGKENHYKIRQEYMQNRQRILQFGWTDADYFYCEPEGIKVMGRDMYILYSIRGNDSHPIRRPVIFHLETPYR